VIAREDAEPPRRSQRFGKTELHAEVRDQIQGFAPATEEPERVAVRCGDLRSVCAPRRKRVSLPSSSSSGWPIDLSTAQGCATQPRARIHAHADASARCDEMSRMSSASRPYHAASPEIDFRAMICHECAYVIGWESACECTLDVLIQDKASVTVRLHDAAFVCDADLPR